MTGRAAPRAQAQPTAEHPCSAAVARARLDTQVGSASIRDHIAVSWRRNSGAGGNDESSGQLHGGGDCPESCRAGVPPGCTGGGAVRSAGGGEEPGLPRAADPGTHRRTGAGDHLPRAMDGRPRRRPGQPRVPRRDEQRHRPLQGWAALPPQCVPRGAEVPGVRAGVQKRPDHALAGRRQGRRRLQPQGPERQRGDALLPVVHERVVPPPGAAVRYPRRGHGSGRTGDRIPVRAVQEAHQRVHRRADRQGHQLGRLIDPPGVHRLRRGLLRPGDARHPRRQPEREDGDGIGLRQCRPVHRREGDTAGGQGRDAL